MNSLIGSTFWLYCVTSRNELGTPVEILAILLSSNAPINVKPQGGGGGGYPREID